MATLVEQKRGQDEDENALAFKPGGSHIQIGSISIEISSGEINQECKHFTIRGFVSDQRNKGSRACSPFISDVDGSNSDIPSLYLERPPLEVRKFRWWRCSGCLKDCNSSQGTSKEIATGKSITSQNDRTCSKGLSKLFAKADGGGFTNGTSTYQWSAKGKKVQEDEMRKEMVNYPINDLKTATRKRLLQNGYSQGPSFLKSISEAVVVPFNNINLDKSTSSKKSRGMSKAVMGPPGGFVNDKATSRKLSKQGNLQKSAASSHGMSKQYAMPPPRGVSISKKSSHKLGKGSRLLYNCSSRGSSMLPQPVYARGRGNSASKQQNGQMPEHNSGTWQKGESSVVATSHKKRSYAKRSVQRTESAGDGLELHRAAENEFTSTLNKETLEHGVAKEGVGLMPENFNGDQVSLPLDRNEEVGSSNKLNEQDSIYTNSGRTPACSGQRILDRNQLADDCVNGDSYPHNDGADRSLNSERPSLESNWLFNRPPINNIYDEEEEEDCRGQRLRRVPKIRLLKDVFEKHPTNVGEQMNNNLKASPGATNDISPVKGVSAKLNELPSKRKASPVAYHDTSPEKKAYAIDTLASGCWTKKKRTFQGSEEYLGDSSSGGSKRDSTRVADPENKVVCTPRYRSGVNVSSSDAPIVGDAKKQVKHGLDRAGVEKKTKKARIQNVAPSSVPSQQRNVSRENCGRRLPPWNEALFRSPVHGVYAPASKAEKKNNFLKDGEGGQSVNSFLQFGSNNAGDSASDCIITGSLKMSGLAENCENSSNPLSTVADHHMTSGPTGKELWFSQVQAGGTLVELKTREGSSCAQKMSTTAEAKGRVKDIDINSIPADDRTPETGSADDIPMDIVELLAKHQHERRCDANREKLSFQNPNGETTAQKQYPSMLKPQASYATNGLGRQSDNVFEPSRKNVLIGYPKDDHLCARFTQSQGHVPGGAQYSSSMGTVKSWRNYDSTPLSFRPCSRGILQPVSPFNRFQGLSQAPPLNTQIWPPLMPNRVPVGHGSHGLYPPPPGPNMLPNGSNLKQGTISFNFGNQNPSSSTQPPWNSRTSLEYLNNGGAKQRTADFLSHNSNETIPAMQLLNFVQVAGSRSNTPPVVSNSEFLKKQYAPAPGPHFEPYNKLTGASSSSRHPLYESQGRSSIVDKPCQCSSALPTSQLFAASSAFQNDPSSGAIKNQAAFTSRGQRNTNSPSYNPLVGDLCSHKKRKSTSAGKNAVLRKPLTDADERAIVPVQNEEKCMVNRNPAEILDLKEARRFMIGPEDLRRGKSMPSSQLALYVRRPQNVLKGKGKGREMLHKS